MTPRSSLAPQFRGGGRIEWAEQVVPRPGPGQLLLRVRANALCGSDREQYYRGSAVTPGHETAGEVIEVGSGAATPTGTAGVVYLMDYCGRCRSCRLGHTNQCLDKRADMGFTADGGYGQYELVHETNFFPTPGIPPVAATLLLDVMGTSSHAISRALHARPDVESVSIAGAGPIGLGLAAMCRIILGADTPVLISDVNEYRLALARSLGAETVHTPSDTLPAAARRLGLDGVDAAFDSTGRRLARHELLESLTARRGVLVCIGHGEDLRVDVSAQLIAPERSILGSEYFRYDELPANLQRLRDNKQFLGQIVTHRCPADRLDEAFVTFLTGHTGKVVVERGSS